MIPLLRPNSAEGPILFAGEAVSLAHVGRPAQLARWSREAGFRVAFACGERYAFVAREAGLDVLPLPTIQPETFYTRLRRQIFFYTAAELEEYVEAECELIERVRPALIVSDFRLSLAISTRLTNTPLLSLINAYWSPAAPSAFPLPHTSVLHKLPAGMRRWLSEQIRTVAFRTFAAPLNTVRRAHGLPPLDDFRKQYCAGDACAYLDLPELAPVAAEPDGHFYLGPVAWTSSTQPPIEWEALGRARKLAYVTLGSTGDRTQLTTVLNALCELDLDIALSGVSDVDFQQLRAAIPALETHCRAAALASPAEILKRAALTVCHGGSGTIYQSLAAGVPLLCLPSNPDQALASKGTADFGCAMLLECDRVDVRRLKAAAQRLLHDRTFADAADVIAKRLAHSSTRQRWLEMLDALALRTASVQTAAAAQTVLTSPIPRNAQPLGTGKGDTMLPQNNATDALNQAHPERRASNISHALRAIPREESDGASPDFSGEIIVRPVLDDAELDAVYRITHDAYVERGYCQPQPDGRLIHYPHLDRIPETTIWIALQNGEIIGTTSLTLDGPHGLHVDSDFKAECDAVRRQAGRIAAGWRIATRSACRSERAVVMALIQETINALIANNIETTVYTFNPRHERIYKRLVNMYTIARKEETNGLSNAPAVLMRMETSAVPERWRVAAVSSRQA